MLTPDTTEGKEILKLNSTGRSSRYIANQVLGASSKKSTINDFLKKYKHGSNKNTFKGESDQKRHLPKVLLFDIETAPLSVAVWGLWNNNVGLEMIQSEWFILSYAAKWLGDDEGKIMYKDLRGCVDKEDDSVLLDDLWQLLNEADIVIAQNGIKFDKKKINARFIMNGYKPPSSYKMIDTLDIAKRIFGFTSNRLQWLTDKLNVKYKKLSHGNFSGYLLWKEMLLDNIEAWQECEEYNKHDVFSLEELYIKLAAWDNKHPNFSLYFDEPVQRCRCGCNEFTEDGYAYTSLSKFQRYKCNSCGAEIRSRKNLFTKEKRDSIMMNVSQ